MRAILIGITSLLLVAGCTSVNHVRDAQAAFSDAAAAENASRFEPGFASESVAASAGYAAALASVDRLESDSDALNQAKADELWGVMLAIKAMAHWRLQHWDEANAAATTARQSQQLAPRDAALMAALPGLIKNDQAVALFRSKTFSCSSATASGCGEEFQKGVALQLRSAESDLTAARRAAPPGHPVRVYLAVSTVGVLENAAHACASMRVNDTALSDTQLPLCRRSVLGLTDENAMASNRALRKELLRELCPEISQPPVRTLAEKLTLSPNEAKEACPALGGGTSAGAGMTALSG